MKRLLVVLCSIIFYISYSQKTIEVTSTGLELRQFYLNQNVEHLWLSGHHINWETGELNNPEATKGIKTHCSSFVASVCKQKGVYILRPPLHKTGLLANAQFDWLLTEEAHNKGWHQIKDSVFEKGQEYANNGFLVVAVYKNPNLKKPGHIALVIPFEKSFELLNNEGPTLIQAGNTNKNFIALKDGFKHHISEWASAKDIIMLFYNDNIEKK